jgi:hypothetical protein
LNLRLTNRSNIANLALGLLMRDQSRRWLAQPAGNSRPAAIRRARERNMAHSEAIVTAVLFGLQLGASQMAFAQGSYPSRTVTIINPFPPGGTSDIVTRPLAAALEPIIKQPVVIETKAGAAGAVGAQFVANSVPTAIPSFPTSVSFGLCRGRQAVRPKAEVHPRRLYSDRTLHG